MTNLANYTQIATVVKEWAGKLSKLDLSDPSDQITLGLVAADMHAFGNGLDMAVATFSGLLAGDNVVHSNDFVMIRVQNCRRYPNFHKPHVYDDHGTDFACWGEGV